MPESSSKACVELACTSRHNAPWCLTTSAHRLDAEGRKAALVVLEAMLTKSNAQCLVSIKHFAFGKRVWTRYAPTARARAAICVQRFDDSLNPAIHITYRVSRRSSSLLEPRDPSLKGGFWFDCCLFKNHLVVWVKKKRCECPGEHPHETLHGVYFLSCECY